MQRKATVDKLLAAFDADTPAQSLSDRRRRRHLTNKIISHSRRGFTRPQQETYLHTLLLSSEIDKGQYRENNKTPYFLHLLAVLSILIDCGIYDFKLLCAAALHDTVEDTEQEKAKRDVKKRIKKLCGIMVLHIVLLLTKRKGEDKDMVWQRMLSEPDLNILWRVLTIKYADRIHNIRTLQEIKDWIKRARKLQETMKWFPLIHSKLKRALQNLWNKRTLKDRSRLHLADKMNNQLQAALEGWQRTL